MLYIILNQENSKSPQKTKFKVLFKKKLLVPHFTPLRTQENTFLFHFYWMKLFMKPWWSFTSSGVSRFGASEITCQKCLTTTHFPIKIELAFFAFGSVVSFFRVKPPVIVEWQQLKPIMPVINVIENELPYLLLLIRLLRDTEPYLVTWHLSQKITQLEKCPGFLTTWER